MEFSRPEYWRGQPRPSVTLVHSERVTAIMTTQNASGQSRSPAPMKRPPSPSPPRHCSLCPRTRVLSGLIQRAVQPLSLCARLLPLRRDLRAHLCCSRCPDALPSQGGVRSRCLRGPHSVYHPPIRCSRVSPGVSVAAVSVVRRRLCEALFQLPWVNTLRVVRFCVLRNQRRALHGGCTSVFTLPPTGHAGSLRGLLIGTCCFLCFVSFRAAILMGVKSYSLWFSFPFPS